MIDPFSQEYVDALEQLRELVLDVVKRHGPPRFMLPPVEVWMPAPLDVVGKALAANDAAREIVARAAGQDFSLIMLDAILVAEKLPFHRLTLKDLVELLNAGLGGALVAFSRNQQGEALLRGALRARVKGPTS